MKKRDEIKFTEVIPDKKKLPKKKDEFIPFLSDYNVMNPSIIQEFLDQYED